MLLYQKLNNLFHFPVLKNFFFGIWVTENRKLKGYAILKTIQELDLMINLKVQLSYFRQLFPQTWAGSFESCINYE